MTASASAPVTGLSYPRAARLLRRAEFLATQRHGRRRAGRWLALYAWSAPAGDRPTRCGFTISRRVSTRAVRRNRIRRVLREAIRMRRADIPCGTWLVVIARSEAADASADELRGELLRLLAAAHLLAGGDA